MMRLNWIGQIVGWCALWVLPMACHQAVSLDKASLELQGYVEGELSYMAAPFSGELKILSKQRGESVKQGDRLFVLEQEPQSMQLAAAQSAVLQAESRFQLAVTRLDRSQKLYQDKAIQKDSVDAALDERNEAQNALESARQKTKELEWSLSEKIGKAPVDGVIYDTYFRKGEWVQAGMPILSLLAPENIKILFFLPEKILSFVKVNEKIKVKTNGKSYEVRIEYISPQVEYTPPVIFSRENDVKLVYRVKAVPLLSQAYDFHPGQPVIVQFS